MSEKSIYNPLTRYKWDKETEFSLNGNEFGIILNTFRTILATPEAQKILLLNSANDVMEEILKRNVENGIVKPSDDITENLQQANQMKVVKKSEDK